MLEPIHPTHKHAHTYQWFPSSSSTITASILKDIHAGACANTVALCASVFSWQSGNVSEIAPTCYKHAATYTNIQRLTCEVISRPGAQFTGSAGVLVEHKLIFFTGSARPTAAHLTFTDHL